MEYESKCVSRRIKRQNVWCLYILGTEKTDLFGNAFDIFEIYCEIYVEYVENGDFFFDFYVQSFSAVDLPA